MRMVVIGWLAPHPPPPLKNSLRYDRIDPKDLNPPEICEYCCKNEGKHSREYKKTTKKELREKQNKKAQKKRKTITVCVIVKTSCLIKGKNLDKVICFRAFTMFTEWVTWSLAWLDDVNTCVSDHEKVKTHEITLNKLKTDKVIWK